MASVRDHRGANWFWVNNSLIDEYGDKIGAHGIALYALLARHADKNGHAIPSLRYIAQKLGVGTSTVQRYIDTLLKYGLIERQRRISEHGDFTSTEYILLNIQDQQESGVSTVNTPVSTVDTPMVSADTPVSTVNTPVSTVNRQVYPQQIHGVSTVNTEQDLLKKTHSEQDKPNLPPSPKHGKLSRKKTKQQPSTDYTPGFELAWEAYPPRRKEGKVDTFAIWLVRELEDRAVEIAEKLERLQQTLWKDREPKYIPLPTTWFNQGRYEDDLVPLPDFDPVAENVIDAKTLRSMQAAQRIMEESAHAPERPRGFLSCAQHYGGIFR